MSASVSSGSGGGDNESDVAFLRADLLRTKQELKQLQDSFDEYTQSSHELEQELEQELSRAEKKNAFLSAKSQQFEGDLQTARDKLESALLQAHKYERELFGLRDELALAVEAKRKLEQEQDDLVTQVRILQATEEDLRHKMEREMEEKVFLVSDQEELQREHELAAERFRTEIVDLKSELYALQQKFDAAIDEELNAGSKNQMEIDDDGHDDRDEDDEYLHRRSTVHERDAESQEVLIKSLQKEIEVLSARAQEETEARERLEAELIQIQDNLAHVESMEAEMMEMTEEVIAKAQEIRKRDMEIQALQEQTTRFKMALAALTEANSDLSTACEELRGQIGDKLIEVKSLAQALSEAEAKCNVLSESEIRLASCLESEVELVVSLQVQVQELMKTIEEEMRLRKELEEQIQTSKSEISQNRREVQELQDENSALRDKLENAAKKAVELERVSAMSTASTSSSTSGDLSVADTDSHRLLLEIQSLRAKLNSIGAENVRLRSQEGTSADFTPNKKISANLLTINYTGEQLARKYLAERTRNASLLSRLQTVCGNIQVFCRVRPVIYEELQKSWGTRLAVNVINHSDVAVMDIKADRVFSSGERTIDGSIDALALESLESSASWKVFTFDRILGPEETQNDVFREVEPIAQSVVEGFKACIFAYGQTGSGKTYTMEGTESDPGLNYRVVRHIFQSVQLRGSIYDPDEAINDNAAKDPAAEDDVDMADVLGDDDKSVHAPCYQVQVGVLEIYNETLRDLISVENSKSLEIRHDSESGDIHVSDLTMATVSSPEQTVNVLHKAQANRITGQTNVHARSSRSHCVVIVQISTANKNDGSNANEAAANDALCGKLYLVDLAGSERVKHSNVSGEMLREAAHINKSLSALADVMEALDKKLPHVPYRNSKLTFLLQDVLNSSCKTVMIVNVGPTYETANESSRSLQLAERVRHIVVGRNSIVKNKKDILSAKKAFSEIQTLKQQLSISARKYKQAQQSLVAMKRDQKNHTEKQSAALQSRIKTSESQKSTYKTQNDALKRLNDELNEQLKQERDARQREADQREVAQRMLRQLNAKSRVSSSHQESVESLLKDREAEIKKLRHLLTEARQRSTTSLIPRLGSPAVLSKRTTNQNDENENPVSVRPARALSTAAGTSTSTSSSQPLLRKRNSSSLGSTRLGTKPRTEAPLPGESSMATTAGTEDSTSPSGPRARRATSLRATSTDSSVRAWK